MDWGQRVLYVGDFDRCGGQIEAASRRTLIEHSDDWADDEDEAAELWERVALTAGQVEEFGLPVISKPDKRHKPVRYFNAVETEALGQGRIVDLVRTRLDELMPEPLADVLERQRVERVEVAGVLAGLVERGDQ